MPDKNHGRPTADASRFVAPAVSWLAFEGEPPGGGALIVQQDLYSQQAKLILTTPSGYSQVMATVGAKDVMLFRAGPLTPALVTIDWMLLRLKHPELWEEPI